MDRYSVKAFLVYPLPPPRARIRTGIKQHAKLEYSGARSGNTHTTEPWQRYVYPLYFLTFRVISYWMKLRQPYIFNPTGVKYFITLDKERKEKDYVYINIAAAEELS